MVFSHWVADSAGGRGQKLNTFRPTPSAAQKLRQTVIIPSLEFWRGLLPCRAWRGGPKTGFLTYRRLAKAAATIFLAWGIPHSTRGPRRPLRELDFILDEGSSCRSHLLSLSNAGRPVTLTERAAAQSHFIDLCEVLGQPHPAAADQTGESFTFEKHVSKLHGGKGFADVWKRGFFAWEYKGKHKDL